VISCRRIKLVHHFRNKNPSIKFQLGNDGIASIELAWINSTEMCNSIIRRYSLQGSAALYRTVLWK